MSDLIDAAVRRAMAEVPVAHASGGASDREIEEFEHGLGLRVPPDYRHFLSRYGTFSCAGLEVYGIVPGGSVLAGDVPTAGRSTLDAKAKGLIPEHTVVIKSEGYGPVYLLNCTSEANRPGKVYGWHWGGPVDPDIEQFPSFGEFFAYYVNEYIEIWREDDGSAPGQA